MKRATQVAVITQRTVHVPREGVPLSTLLVQIRSGAGNDPDGQLGRAAIAADLAVLGPRRTARDRFFLMLEKLGAEFSVTTGVHATVIGLSVLSSALEAAVALLEETLADPALRTDDLRLLKREALAAFSGLTDSSDELALAHFYKGLFGRRGYGRPHDGVPRTIHAINAASVREHLTGRLFGSALRVGLAGPGDVEAVAERLAKFAGAHDRVDAGEHESVEAARLTVVETTPRETSRVVIGCAMPAAHDPAHLALFIANECLGGLFTSRLVTRLRSQEGLVYDVGSQIGRNRRVGSFVTAMSPENGNVARAVASALDELQRFHDEGPSDDEIRRAIGAARRRLPFMRLTAERELSLIMANQILGLEDRDHLTWDARLSRLTAAQVRKEVRRHLDPSRMHICIATGSSRAAREVQKVARHLPVTTSAAADL